LPINQAFYLGAHNAGSQVFDKTCQSTQNEEITQMLQDGKRESRTKTRKSFGSLTF
jgi:hypothetical protein